MVTVPARIVREAREGIDRVLPLLRDPEQARRIGRVRNELVSIRGAADNGNRVPIDPLQFEEMQEIVGRVCVNGGIDIRHHEVVADTCMAMREIGVQMESVIA